MRASVLGVLLAACAGAATAEGALTALTTGDDVSGWQAVGRIDIDGKGFCTGALIAPDLVLTAAHCVYDRETGALIGPERFHFLAGLRHGRAEAYRDVRRVLAHPSFEMQDGGGITRSINDVALLALDQPIRSTEVIPFEVDAEDAGGGVIGIVSYAFDRAEVPSLEQLCEEIMAEGGLYVLACDVDFGSSGAPVFRIENGVARIVSVVSAKAEYAGEPVAIGTMLATPLADLMAELGAGGALAREAPPGVRVLTPGQRNETGARFVTPGGS